MSVSSAGSASSNNKSFGAAIFCVLNQLDHQNNEKTFDLRIGWDLNSQLHGQQTAFITTRPKRNGQIVGFDEKIDTGCLGKVETIGNGRKPGRNCNSLTAGPIVPKPSQDNLPCPNKPFYVLWCPHFPYLLTC